MRDPRAYYITRTKREKVLVSVVCIIALVVMFYYLYDVATLGNQEKYVALEDKTILLRKLQGVLSRKEIVKEEASGLGRLGDINLILATHEGRVLTEIPRLLKTVSAQSNLVISKSDLVHKEVLLKDPLLLELEIDLKVEYIPRAEELQEFIYLLENNDDFTCYIKDMKIKELAGAEGVSLAATLETFALISR